MSQLTGEERARYVHNTFSRIAKRYNLMNRLMTAGQDIHWRREAIRRLRLNPGDTCWTWEPAPATWGGKRCTSSRPSAWWQRISISK